MGRTEEQALKEALDARREVAQARKEVSIRLRPTRDPASVPRVFGPSQTCFDYLQTAKTYYRAGMIALGAGDLTLADTYEALGNAYLELYYMFCD